jgi:soluble lytic murein transglycosylase
MIKFFLLLSISTFILANEITMQWLEKQPKSYAKDFYIWRYLNQDITAQEAQKALSQVRWLNNKILYRYISKSDNPILQDYKRCMRGKTQTIIKKQDYCIEAGLSIYDATKLSKQELEQVIQKVQKEYPSFAKKLAILHSALPFKSLIESDSDTFYGVFNQTGSAYRAKFFNETFPLKTLQRLQKDERDFTTMVKLIVTNPKMKKAQKSLLNFSNDSLNFQTTFALAINAIQNKAEKKALEYLEIAYKKAYFQMEKDNVLFWQYQLTEDKKYLDTLSSSWDVNIYTLFANNELKKPQQNIVYTIEQKPNSKSLFDIEDPFIWHKVLSDSKKMDDEKLKKYEKLFSNDDTLGHLAFVKERYSKYKKSYFVTPYQEYLHKLDKNRQALIYAIGRQESRFIPTSISTAYAMGVMQIMPFLSKALAKQLKEPYDIDKQLEAKTNLRYADHHLDFLEYRLNNPLFIAYGYNGGIGFTRRSLKQGLFQKSQYEPWLSMELISYSETKKYGKKVLANYFIYQNYLNPKNKITFDQLIAQIKNY